MAWKQGLSKAMQELRCVKTAAGATSFAPYHNRNNTQTSYCRIHLCQTSPASKGARDFVLGSYAELKKANPDFPILVREASGTEAKLIARYDYGVEKAVSIQGLDAAAVGNKVQELVNAGDKLPKSGE